MINQFSPITNKLTGSLQLHINDYLALLVTLLIRVNQILLICSCACVVGYPSTFE